MVTRRLSAAWICVIAATAAARAAIAAEKVEVSERVFCPRDASAARALWHPVVGGKVSCSSLPTGGVTAVRFPCTFSSGDDRCCWEARRRLDLSRMSDLQLWVRVRDPGVIRRCTLYLGAGNGWYAGWFDVRGGGWRRIRLSRCRFEIEGSPAGWDAIDKVRVSFWKAREGATAVDVAGPWGSEPVVAVVRGNRTIRKGTAESAVADSYSKLAADWLSARIEGVCVVEESDMARGLPGSCRVAFMPYNPDLEPGDKKAIANFVSRGGKLIIAYTLAPDIAPLIGLQFERWQGQKYEGQYNVIRLPSQANLPLPPELIQESWNVTVPRLDGAAAIGTWHDAQGRDTSVTAATLHRNGIFIGHVLTRVDAERKQRMLVAAMARLCPDLGQNLAAQEIERASSICGAESWEESVAFVTGEARKHGREAEAARSIETAAAVLASARDSFRRGRTGEALAGAAATKDALVAALCRAYAPREGEFRGVWLHSGIGVPGVTWDAAAERLAAQGFTALVPNMLWAGRAFYPSKLLPPAAEMQGKGDQLAECLAACRRHGIEMHVWKVNWNLAGSPPDFVARMKTEGRLQRDAKGGVVNWLCPSDPRNLEFERETMLEVVRKYAVDGLHFDYIRYPDGGTCCCEGCRKRFEQASGRAVRNWPADAFNGARRDEFQQWRCEQITRLVRAVSTDARTARPGIRISAAVFPRYPSCRDTVGQDWALWLKKGYVDFVCPMNYTAKAEEFTQFLAQQAAAAGRGSLLCPGIGASSPGLFPEEVLRQVQLARDAGTKGFMVFEYDTAFARLCLPALAAGATARER